MYCCRKSLALIQCVYLTNTDGGTSLVAFSCSALPCPICVYIINLLMFKTHYFWYIHSHFDQLGEGHPGPQKWRLARKLACWIQCNGTGFICPKSIRWWRLRSRVWGGDQDRSGVQGIKYLFTLFTIPLMSLSKSMMDTRCGVINTVN